MEKKRDERREVKGQKKRGRLSRRTLIGRMTTTETNNAQVYLHKPILLERIPLDGKHACVEIRVYRTSLLPSSHV